MAQDFFMLMEFKTEDLLQLVIENNQIRPGIRLYLNSMLPGF